MATKVKSAGLGGKLGNLLGSIRFWQITIASGVYAASHPEQLLETVAGWLLAVAGVGTVDKLGERK